MPSRTDFGGSDGMLYPENRILACGAQPKMAKMEPAGMSPLGELAGVLVLLTRRPYDWARASARGPVPTAKRLQGRTDLNQLIGSALTYVR